MVVVVVVEGDVISIQPRFAGLFADPPVSAPISRQLRQGRQPGWHSSPVPASQHPFQSNLPSLRLRPNR
jgi:hypothetical protein